MFRKLRHARTGTAGANDNVRYIQAMSAREATPFPERTPQRIAILAIDTVVPFDLGVPCQVFGWGRRDLGEVRYQAVVCAATRGRVRTSLGFFLEVPWGLEALQDAETIVVAGISDLDVTIPDPVCAALREAADRGARVASVCTGAFVLARAGLLDGRRAATHWEDAPVLAERYPAVQVDPEVLYVDEGRVLTSAGIAAGIDLCLHMVRRDYGAEVANAVARRLVMPPHRSGGQAQFAERPLPRAAGSGLEECRAWILDHLAEPLTLERMAKHAHMSRRTFSRRFRVETGSTPLRWLNHQRVLLAQHLLERSGTSLTHIATRCGFGSAQVLRLHFRRALGTTPSAYRKAFRGPGPGTSHASGPSPLDPPAPPPPRLPPAHSSRGR